MLPEPGEQGPQVERERRQDKEAGPEPPRVELPRLLEREEAECQYNARREPIPSLRLREARAQDPDGAKVRRRGRLPRAAGVPRAGLAVRDGVSACPGPDLDRVPPQGLRSSKKIAKRGEF